MNIHLEYTAVLAIKGAANNSDVALEDGTTVGALLERLGIQPAHRKYVVVFVNGGKEKLATVLKDGDRVALSLPVGGG